MADFSECLGVSVTEGRLSRDQADDAIRTVTRMERKFSETMGEDMARRAAVDDFTRNMQAEAARRKHLANLQIIATERVIGEAFGHEKGFTAGAMSHLVKDIWGVARYSNVEARKESILGQLHRMFSDGIDSFRAKFAGTVQDKAGQRDFIRELYNESTGNGNAKAAAKSWAETSEFARKRFNDAGGDIGKLDDWRVPQTHDRLRVKRAGYDEWRKTFTDADRARMRDAYDLDDAELDDALQEVFLSISTGGLNKAKPGGAGQGRKLANRRGDERFLIFADADSWLRYNDTFGAGDIYSLITSYMDGMARDISALEILGPNPAAMVRHLADLARIEEAKAPDMSLAAQARPDRVTVRLMESPKMIEDTFEAVSGRLNIPANELTARFWGGLRNLLSVAQLGSAPVSATSDIVFLSKTATWNGLPAAKVMKRYTSLLNPTNAEGRRFAARSGLVAQAWVGKAISAKRFQDEIVGDGWTSRTADFFHRISGLTPMTQAGRWAIGLEFMGTLAEQSGKSMRQLDPALKRAFKNYGVTSKMWDAARKTEFMDFDGAQFMNPADMASNKDATLSEAGQRLHEMILTETDFAVPEPDARVRAMATQGTQRGTFVGEIWRSVLMYKSFPITIMNTHLMQGVAQKDTAKGLYLMGLMTGLTVMGGVVTQTKQVLSGKDPRDMTKPEFWGQAFMQGGGIGIYGDFLSAAVGRNEQDLVKTVIGPMAGFATDVVRLTSQNAREFIEGSPTRFSSEAIRFAGRYNPLSSLWYTKTAFDRTFMRWLRIQADPSYARGFQARERWARQNFGQGFYWRPGSAGPDRAPDLNAAIGDR